MHTHQPQTLKLAETGLADVQWQPDASATERVGNLLVIPMQISMRARLAYNWACNGH